MIQPDNSEKRGGEKGSSRARHHDHTLFQGIELLLAQGVFLCERPGLALCASPRGDVERIAAPRLAFLECLCEAKGIGLSTAVGLWDGQVHIAIHVGNRH